MPTRFVELNDPMQLALAADVEPELAAVISAGDTVLLGIPRAVPYPLETAPA